MAKDPAFLFYSKDFLTGIQDLTMEERGQYITLLSLQHQKGHLTDKAIRLAVADAAADVMAKFRQDPAGLWYNERLDEEIDKRKVHTEKQRERALEGWKKRKKDAAGDTTANAAALPLVNANVDVIIISKELCKIFGKEYQAPTERMAAESNWYKTIEDQAVEILTVWKPPEATKQIQAYLRYCKSNDRKTIGKNYKAAETVLSSNWLELLGENQARAPNKFTTAEVDKENLTLEAWEAMYAYKLKYDDEFKKHFKYDGKLSPGLSVGLKSESG